MINIAISDNSIEILRRLDGLPTAIQEAVVAKVRATVEEVYDKVHGALPKFQIERGTEVQGSLVIGWFEPSEPKAIAREFGGKGYYEIVPTKARVLRFLGSRDGKMVHTDFVWHPPSREFRDIRDALDTKLLTLGSEIEEIIARELP